MNGNILVGYVLGILVGWATAFCFVKVREALTEIFINNAQRRLKGESKGESK